MMTQGGVGDPGAGGWWLPIALVVVSFFVLMAFETSYAIHDRDALADQRQLQESAVQEAVKLRQKLEVLAGKTAQLAADGDENAKSIVDQMKRQGITLSPPKQ
jgi:F0F1-type ATP synthase membrane subunit b/b'